MSLINDALKRAKAQQSAAPPPDLLYRPVEPLPERRARTSPPGKAKANSSWVFQAVVGVTAILGLVYVVQTLLARVEPSEVRAITTRRAEPGPGAGVTAAVPDREPAPVQIAALSVSKPAPAVEQSAPPIVNSAPPAPVPVAVTPIDPPPAKVIAASTAPAPNPPIAAATPVAPPAPVPAPVKQVSNPSPNPPPVAVAQPPRVSRPPAPANPPPAVASSTPAPAAAVPPPAAPAPAVPADSGLSVVTPTAVEEIPQSLPRLQAVVSHPTRPSAIIGGKSLFVGDRLGDLCLIAVGRASVTVTINGRTNVLLLP